MVKYGRRSEVLDRFVETDPKVAKLIAQMDAEELAARVALVKELEEIESQREAGAEALASRMASAEAAWRAAQLEADKAFESFSEVRRDGLTAAATFDRRARNLRSELVRRAPPMIGDVLDMLREASRRTRTGSPLRASLGIRYGGDKDEPLLAKTDGSPRGDIMAMHALRTATAAAEALQLQALSEDETGAALDRIRLDVIEQLEAKDGS